MFPLGARGLAFLCVAVLLPRALLSVVLGVTGNPQRWEYDVTAASIVGGEGHFYDRLGFTYAAYAPPLWSYILAALLLLPGDSRVSIQILQALFCLGTALAASSLTHQITKDARVGMLAGLFVALQPSLLYYSVAKSDPLPLNAFLLSIIIFQGIELVRSPSPKRAVGLGALLGLGILARGTPVVALPLIALALLNRWGRAGWRHIAAAALGCALCVAPWTWRNLVVLGAPILTSTAGENFWRGNHEGASGGVRDADGGAISQLFESNKALPEPIRQAVAHGTELERQDAFTAEAWRFIQSDPLAALRLYGAKLRTFWWRIDSRPEDYPVAAAVAYEWIYRVELGLAILGVFIALRLPGRDAALLALSVMVAISLLQCAFYVQGRHRFLIEPILLLFTAIGVAQLTRSARSSL